MQTETLTRNRPAPRPRLTGQLRAGTITLATAETEVQLGLDERWAVRLCGLKPAEVELLTELAARAHVPAGTIARRIGVSRPRLGELIEVLRQAGFWQDDVERQSDMTVVRATADGAADTTALGALRSDNLGLETLVIRATKTVAILDGGRLGAAIARTLATAGVGRFIVPDRMPVQVTDLGLGGYRRADTGKPRCDALAAQLEECSGSIVLRDGHPDLVVSLAYHAISSATSARWMGEALPHLAVLVREADVEVGPFVLPGQTACLNCYDLRQRDHEPNWTQLAPQLCALPARPTESVLTATAAALVSAQVLAHLDGLTPAASTAVYRIALPQALPEPIPIEPHPACGCRELLPKGQTVPAGSFDSPQGDELDLLMFR